MKPIIAVSPSKVSLVLLLIAVLLVGLQYAAWNPYRRLFPSSIDAHRLFTLDVESNIPTWYATCLLLLCAALLAVIGRATHQMGAPYAPHWRALSAIFVLLSLDESASLHEMLIEPIQQAYNLSGPLLFAWVIPGAIFVLLVAVAYSTFVVHLPARTRLQVLAAATVYLGGVLGLESLGAWYTSAYQYGDWIYLHLTTVEESVEMLGLIGLIYALLAYIESRLHIVGFQVGRDGATSHAAHPS